jgi:transposase
MIRGWWLHGVVERTNPWLLAYRRLATRFGRRAASVLAFLHLACALVCLSYPQQVGQD